MPKWPRRIVQTGTIIFLVAVSALNYGGILYQQFGKNAYHTISLMGTPFERALYSVFSAGAAAFPRLIEYSSTITGGFGSFSILGLTFMDPVVAAETFVREPSAWSAILGGIALTLLIAVLMGRVFCGWLCPVNTVLEGIDLLRSRVLPRMGFTPPNWAAPRWLKWVLFLGGVSLSLVADVAFWVQVLPHVQIGRDVFSLIFFGALTAVAPLLAIIVFAELLISRRVWCRSLCPTGAVLGLAGFFAPLRIRKAASPCRSGCTACAGVCPMTLNPAEPISQAECLNCGLCLPVCPEELLRLTPARIIPAARPRRVTQSRTRNYSEPIATIKRMTFILVAGALAAALINTPVEAHHMRAQPHYGYAENYPQIPTKETRTHISGFDVIVVSYFFEGLRRERSDTPDDVQFFIGLMDAKTHQSYTGPLSIELLKGGRRIAAFEHKRPLEEAAYRIRQKVSGPGQYVLRLAAGDIRGEIAVEVEGKSAPIAPWAVSIGAVLLAALIIFNRRRRVRFRRPKENHVASDT